MLLSALYTNVFAHAEGAGDALRCRLLLSEVLQDGFTWRRTTVVNPFSPPAHELINVLVDAHRH